MIIYIGDKVTWTWESDENIISCNSDGILAENPSEVTLNSGPLGSKNYHTYTHIFFEEGKYYYRSERSKTMRGFVKVNPRPVISGHLDKFGPVHTIPKGVQHSITTTMMLSYDGCWVVCFLFRPFSTYY